MKTKVILNPDEDAVLHSQTPHKDATQAEIQWVRVLTGHSSCITQLLALFYTHSTLADTLTEQVNGWSQQKVAGAKTMENIRFLFLFDKGKGFANLWFAHTFAIQSDPHIKTPCM